MKASVITLLFVLINQFIFADKLSIKDNEQQFQNIELNNKLVDLKLGELNKRFDKLLKEFDVSKNEHQKTSAELASFSARYEDWKFNFATFLTALGVLGLVGYKIFINRVAFEAKEKFEDLYKTLDASIRENKQIKTALMERIKHDVEGELN